MKPGEKKTALVVSIIFILLIFFSVYVALWRGLENTEMIDLISACFDFFGMLVCLVLYICCMLDVQKTGTDLKYFRYLLIVTFAGIFTDAMSDFIEGVPLLVPAILLNSSVYFTYLPFMVFFFWKYISTFVTLDGRFETVTGKIFKYGLMFMLVSIAVNTVAGYYFTIGADGEYSRGPAFPVAVLYGFVGIVLLLIVICKKRSQLKRFQTVTLLIYVISALIGGVLTVMFKRFNVGSCEAVLVMLLMYCVLNIEQSREKAASDKELSMAAQIQERMLPQDFPYLPHRKEFDLYASMTPAKEVGGDFYDFFMIDDDHLAVVIGDVAGKGVPASLFMMVSRTLIKHGARNSGSSEPGQILMAANDELCEDNQLDMFVTVWIGILELPTGRLQISRAGHEYPAISRGGGRFELYKGRKGLPLGCMEGVPYLSEELVLEPEDTLYIYTDGVPEAVNETNEQFGLDRMLAALNRDPLATVEELDRNVWEDIDAFTAGVQQFDDTTMLCLRYHGK